MPLRESSPHAREDFVKALFDVPRLDAKGAHAMECEVPVPERVVDLVPAMRPAIDFDRDLASRSPQPPRDEPPISGCLPRTHVPARTLRRFAHSRATRPRVQPTSTRLATP